MSIVFLIFLTLSGCPGGEKECTDTGVGGQVTDFGIPPDRSLTADQVSGLSVAGNARIMKMEVWDCLDVSWWTGAEPQKVLQIWADTDTCPGFDSVWVEYYACNSQESPDIYYTDQDGDGLSSEEGDCDDLDASVGAPTAYFFDQDGDGYGAGGERTTSCTPIAGYVTNGQDCDDLDSETYPDAYEACTSKEDRNCDGHGSFVDADGDLVAECEDCNDHNADISEASPELCNGLDDDCDGQPDNGLETLTWYWDEDGDGFGDDSHSVTTCATLENKVLVGGDCNDDLDRVYPGAPGESCTDPGDYDCDGVTTFVDVDGDGVGACIDCDDSSRDIRFDIGQDGTSDCVDDDGDGWTEIAGDINDRNPYINPDNPKEVGDSGDSGDSASDSGGDSSGDSSPVDTGGDSVPADSASDSVPGDSATDTSPMDSADSGGSDSAMDSSPIDSAGSASDTSQP